MILCKMHNLFFFFFNKYIVVNSCILFLYRRNINQSEVKSKYFYSNSGMDESLSDFQEKKKSCCGPKPTQVAKPKPKKPIRRIKGQKDIRTILKSKKNELVVYTNDFDKICKQSGLDVDSEQLQTAIALSKSLQQTENLEGNTPQSSQVLSSQERIGKIRTTLQEYGFKIPEIKITETKSRKLKRSRKNYKLLLTTDIEKQRIISDRYSQVLIQNLDCTRQVANSVEAIPFRYEIATRIAYEQIRDDKTFYIEGLIKRNPNSVGSLLRDWSKIPGRPLSPKIEHSEVDFSDINCNQEELDCVLSGSLKRAQELIKNKHKLLSNFKHVKITEDNSESLHKISSQSKIMEAMVMNSSKMEIELITIDDCEPSPNKELITQENRQQSDKEEIDYETPVLNTHQIKCCSPDIFDDEVSTIMDNSSNKIVTSLETPKDCTNINIDVMDLTECVQISSQKNLIDSSVKNKPSFQLSQDKTKRKSNDFMELTSVVGSSQSLILNNIEENINHSQHSDHENNLTAENKDLKQKHIEVDLTQSSDSGDELPFVEIGGTQTSEETVIISEEAYCGIDEEPKNFSSVIGFLDDNTQTNEEIGINKELVETTPKNDTNYVRTTSSWNLDLFNTSNPLIEAPIDSRNYVINDEIHSITLNSSSDTVENKSIQSTESPLQENIVEDFHQSKSQSFFDEFVHPHSDDISIETEDLSHETPAKSNTFVDKHTNDDVNIDLTQSSDNLLVLANVCDEENQTPEISFGSLGKKDNVSIDYDEVLNDIVNKNSSVSFKDNNETKSIVYDIIDENTAAAKKYTKESELSSSQTSEVFEISDIELDYSMNKSMLEINNPCGNFDFGGIYVVDNLPDLPSIRQSKNHEQSTNQSLNQSQNKSVPPFIDKGSVKANISIDKDPGDSPCGIEASTPFKQHLNQVLNIKTPTNGEYVIKTDQVTPMLNYESMTTPERNRELDKYGLKPFKRKRGKLHIHVIRSIGPQIIQADT